MSAGGQPLFCGTALAERIERAAAQLITAVSDAARRRADDRSGFVIPIAGGVAGFAEAGSPFNKVAGLGFGGIPSAGELDEIERSFAAHGAAVQIELANLADPAIGALLSDRSYRLIGFENVLGRDLTEEPERVAPPGVSVHESGADGLAAWLEVVLEGFAHPDSEGVPSHDEFPRDLVERAERDFAAAGAVRYVALVDGSIAGGGGLHIADRVAQLAGAATAPAYRRRGAHAALLAARLADARVAGCDVAAITTRPGSTSQRNVQRHGFDLLYTRAVLVKKTSALSAGPRTATLNRKR